MRASNLRRLRSGEEKKIERKKEETTGQNIILTVGHKKVWNYIKNQQTLMQFSLLDLEMNDTCDSMNFTHLT